MPVLRYGEVGKEALKSGQTTSVLCLHPHGALSEATPKGMWHHLPSLLPSPLEDSRVLCGTLGQCLGGS